MNEDTRDSGGGSSHPDSTPSQMDQPQESGSTMQSSGLNAALPEAESSRLRELQADVRDQDDLERDIGRQVCFAFFEDSCDHSSLLL